MDEKSGNWTLTSSWKAHHGSVWKVTWANPDFGQILATCSFDQTVSIWEEFCMLHYIICTINLKY